MYCLAITYSTYLGIMYCLAITYSTFLGIMYCLAITYLTYLAITYCLAITYLMSLGITYFIWLLRIQRIWLLFPSMRIWFGCLYPVCQLYPTILLGSIIQLYPIISPIISNYMARSYCCHIRIRQLYALLCVQYIFYFV